MREGKWEYGRNRNRKIGRLERTLVTCFDAARVARALGKVLVTGRARVYVVATVAISWMWIGL